MSWIYRINWILYGVASSGTYSVAFLYWSFLAKEDILEHNLRPANFHVHATTAILMTVDSLVVAFPVRLLHFIYTTIYASIYAIFALILHATKVNSKIYEILDFEKEPSWSYTFMVASIALLPLIFHSLVYVLYRLRLRIAKKIRRSTHAKRETNRFMDATATEIKTAFPQNIPSKLFSKPEIPRAFIFLTENVSQDILSENKEKNLSKQENITLKQTTAFNHPSVNGAEAD